MSYCVMTISRGLFFRLLACAPEALQREATAEARRAIPALCFTEDDIRQKFVVEERWGWLSEAEQRKAIQCLLDASEYEHAGTVANDAIAKAVGRYLDDAFLEKIKQQAVGGFTW
jgi:hypothetical protein